MGCVKVYDGRVCGGELEIIYTNFATYEKRLQCKRCGEGYTVNPFHEEESLRRKAMELGVKGFSPL